VTSSVVLIDDHDLIRQGLRRAFERDADFDVVADLGAVGDALAFLQETQPDVAIVDLRLGDGNGLEVVRAAREARSDMGIVVLTMYAGDEQLFAALEAGASAFVSKDASADEVVAAARHAVASPRSFSAADLAGAMDRRMNPTGPRLSRREQEVLELLAEGLSVSAIASRLYISESTAKTHIAKLYEKLGAGNRASAIMAALKAGLIESPGAT
jgi:DNA-binding NarL/FixJ family response regulator